MSIFALEVTGDAMAPSLIEGDTVQVNPTEMPISNGKDVAVLEVEGNYHVCRFVRFGKQILMIHDNAPISVVSASAVKIIGKVIWSSFTPVNKESHTAGNDVAFGW